jgi:hypothetical protein
MAPQTSMFPLQQLYCNRGTVFSVRSVSICYEQDKLGMNELLVGELVRELLRFSCELLLLETGS